MRLQKRMDKETGRRKESARPKETGGRRGSKRPGQMIGAAFLMVAVSSYAQYQISALSGLVMESYQITARQYSQVFTAAMIPGILLSLLCGILCDHFGIRRCFGAAVLISGAGGILRIWSQDYRTMAACMILTGIAITFVNYYKFCFFFLRFSWYISASTLLSRSSNSSSSFPLVTRMPRLAETV